MIRKHKKLILILSIVFVVVNLLAIPFIFILDNKDVLPVFNIVLALLSLLFINFGSSYISRMKFNEGTGKKKIEKEQLLNIKEQKIILWIYFALVLLFGIILGFALY